MIEQHAASMEEFFAAIRRTRAAWYPSPYDPAEIWFRGQGNGSLPLLPGLLRLRPGFAPWDEETLLNAFRSQACAHGGPSDDEWDWYFRAQHYGIPTRLLDWTSSAMAALFFAIQREVNERAPSELRAREAAPEPGYGARGPAVWMMDAGSLNTVSVGAGTDHVLVPGGDVDRYLPSAMARSAETPGPETANLGPPALPAALLPRWSNPRILAQQGMFTIHGADPRPIESLGEADLKLARIWIAPNRIQGIWDDLACAGTTLSTLFPEPEHIAEYIKRQYAQEAPPDTEVAGPR